MLFGFPRESLSKMVLKMKLLAFLMFTVMAVSASDSYSQETKFSFKLKDATVREVFDHIEENSEFILLYNEKWVDVNRRVDIDVKNETVEKVLDQTFKGTRNVYHIYDRQIVILEDEKAEMPANVQLQIAETQIQQPQQKEITGTVTDSDGLPLPGVSVVVKGTTIGTVTNPDGEFSLRVPVDAEILQFSFVGMKTQEIPIEGRTRFTVVMEEETIGIEEVVAVGFGYQKKENLTGSVSQIKMEEVVGNRPVINAANALQGAIPGLQIMRNSSPGQRNNSINIRGTLSINGGDPLILIDNVPGDIGMLNPEDIETVTVLKDAASAAIYGARAAGGVVLITTKRPESNSPFTVNYNNNFGFESSINKAEQASLEDYLQAYLDAGFNGGAYHAGQNTLVETWQDYLRQYKENPSSLNVIGDGIFKEESTGAVYYLNEKDLYANMFEEGFMMNHNLAVSGGTERVRYRMSAGYNKDNGPLITSKDNYNRKSVSGFVSADMTSWFTQEMDIRYSHAENSMPVDNFGGLYDLRLVSYYPEGLMPKEINTQAEEDLPTNTPKNIILNSNTSNNKTDNPRIFLKSIVEPFEGLKMIFEYTYNRNNRNYSYYTGQWAYTTYQMGVNYSVPSDYYTKTNSFSNYNAINTYFNFSKSLGSHNFKLTGGFNQESSYHESLYTIAYDQAVQSTPSFGGATGKSTISDGYSEFTLRSGFYRINYNYKDKYLIESNGRYDGSSKFPKNNRFGFFPSLSLGWQIGKEGFMDASNNWLHELKLRASYGSMGNQNISPYQYTPSMGIGQSSVWLMDNSYVTVINSPELISSNFTWETVTTFDIGLDFALLQHRLQGTVDWYQRDTDDMLTAGIIKLPSVVGAPAPTQNSAKMTTKGWEFSLKWSDRINKFGYRISANLYDHQSEIVDYYANESGLISDYYNGRMFGEIWGYLADGYYSVDDFSDLNSWQLKEGVPSIQGVNVRPGDVKFKNLMDDEGSENQIDAGNGTLENSGDRVIIGNSMPRYQYGLTFGANYGGFDIDVMLQGIGKRDTWLNKNAIFPFGGAVSTDAVFRPIFYNQTDYWKPISTDPEDPNYMVAENPDAEHFRIYDLMQNSQSNTRVSDKYLQKSNYLRVKNVTLSYSFPKRWLQGFAVQQIKLFSSIENLATFSSLPKGYDPENIAWTYPFYRTISFGANINF